MKAAIKGLNNIWILNTFFSILFLVINACFTIRFESNDDAVMMLISSGKYTGSSNDHLVFINFIFGRFLNLLYDTISGIEWYTYLIISLNIFTSSVISKTIISSKKNRIFKGFMMLFTVAIFCNFTLLLQYTRTSALLAIAGFLSLTFLNQRILGIVLFALAALLRFEMAVFIFLILSPTIIISKGSFLASLKSNASKGIIISILLAISFKGLDKLYYDNDPEWKTFTKYNNERGILNDHPYLQKSRLPLPDGISNGDLKLFLYAVIDSKVMSQDKLDELNASLGTLSFGEKWERTSNFFGDHKFHIALVLITAAIVSLQDPKRIMAILISVSFSGALIIFIALDATIKSRLIEPAVFGIILSLFLCVESKKSRRLLILSSLTLIVFSVSILSNTKQISSYSHERRQLFKEQLSLINNYLKSNNKNLIPYGPSYHIEFENPFHVSKNYPQGRITFAGWVTLSPLNKGKFQSHLDFTEEYSLVTFSQATKETQNLVSTSLLKNYRIKVSPKLIFKESDLAIIEFPTKSK